MAVTDGVAMLNRLKLEGTGTQADVVLGLDTNLTAEAKATGLFGPHGQDASKLTLPIAWTDDTFLPYDYAHFAVVYDTEKMPRTHLINISERVERLPLVRLSDVSPRSKISCK